MIEKVRNLMQKYTKHKYIKLTNSGNLAIFGCMYFLRRYGIREMIIPDQGGWLTYKEYPMILGLKLTELKTDYGIVHPNDLKRYKNKKCALLITSFAGYFAEQPLRKISEACRKNMILLIEDAAGSISDRELCNGSYSDIIIGSFGRWKVVDNHQGGFISTNIKDFLNDSFDSVIKPIMLDEERLCLKLLEAPKRLKLLLAKAENVKKDLKREGIKIFHPEKRGVVVVAELSDKVVSYCKKNNIEFTVCPRYIRVNEQAVSIELKRL